MAYQNTIRLSKVAVEDPVDGSEIPKQTGMYSIFKKNIKQKPVDHGISTTNLPQLVSKNPDFLLPSTGLSG